MRPELPAIPAAPSVTLLVAAMLPLGACPTTASARGSHCSADDLTSAPASAVAGDTVRIGFCEGSGNFRALAGITPVGYGHFSRLHLFEGTVATVLETAAEQTTRLVDIRVKDGGPIATQACAGCTGLSVSSRFNSRNGVSGAAQAATKLRITGRAFCGSLTPDGTPSVTPFAPLELFTTHAIVPNAVAGVRIDAVHAEVFARYGALLVSATSEVRRSTLRRDVAAGPMIHAGTADLVYVVVTDTYRGKVGKTDQASGFACAGGALLTTMGSSALRNQDWDVFHNEPVIVTHQNLRVADTMAGETCVRNGQYRRLDRADLSRNGVAGRAATDTGTAVLNDNLAQDTTAAVLPGLAQNSGEGIPLVNGVAFQSNVSLTASGRAALIAARGPVQFVSADAFEGVTASGLRERDAVLFQQGGARLAVVADGAQHGGPRLQNGTHCSIGRTALELVAKQPPCYLSEPIQLLRAALASLFMVTA